MSLRIQLLTQVRRDVGTLIKDYPVTESIASRVQQELDGWIALLTRPAIPSQAEQDRHFTFITDEMVMLAAMHKEIDAAAAVRIEAIYALFKRAKP